MFFNPAELVGDGASTAATAGIGGLIGAAVAKGVSG